MEQLGSCISEHRRDIRGNVDKLSVVARTNREGCPPSALQFTQAKHVMKIIWCSNRGSPSCWLQGSVSPSLALPRPKRTVFSSD